MKLKNYLRTIAIFISILLISLPFTYAEELNLIMDVNGNLVTGDSFYREYNELNQLIRIRQGNTSSGAILEEFVWHPTEERVLVKDVFSNGVLNYSIYYVNKNYIHIENSSGNYTEKYIYQDNVLVAQVNTDGQKQFVHNDHLGSTSLITDVNGNVVENSFYEPFGNIIKGGNTRYDYNAKEKDVTTGEYDYGARMYKSEWGKFVVPDTLTQHVYEPQFLNHYSYTLNNPYKFVDPNGHVVVYFWGLSGDSSDLEKLQTRETSPQPSVVTSHRNLDFAEEFVTSALERDKNQPVIIVGHSLGGDSALRLSENLQENQIEVDLIVTIDKRGFLVNAKPDNVKELINIRQEGGKGPDGKEIEEADEEYVLSKIKHTDIDNIDKNSLLGLIPKKVDDLYGKYKSGGGGGGGSRGSNVDCTTTCTTSCTRSGKCTTTCKTKCKLKG